MLLFTYVSTACYGYEQGTEQILPASLLHQSQTTVLQESRLKVHNIGYRWHHGSFFSAHWPSCKKDGKEQQQFGLW